MRESEIERGEREVERGEREVASRLLLLGLKGCCCLTWTLGGLRRLKLLLLPT